MKIIKEFIKANQGNFELASPKVTMENLSDVEMLTKVDLISEMKEFIIQLGSLKFKSDDNDVNTICTPIVHEISIKKIHKSSEGGVFGFPPSDNEAIGLPIIELNNIDDYKNYIENFRGMDYELDGKDANFLELYPCPLFDVYGDGHQLICIDYKGRVVSVNYEIDETDCTILANTQKEFINNLFIDSYETEII